MRCVLYDVYKCLSVSRWTKFFTRDEKNWSEYLQRQDAFTPKAYAELQHKQRVTLDTLLKEERKAAMKRFLTTLLFVVVLVVLFFSIGGIVSICCGAEPMHITISEPLPPQSTPYPSEVYSMTDAEFFQWATDQNDKARAEWEKWDRTASPRWISYGVTIDYERSRRGSYFGSNHERGSVHHYQQRYLNPDYYNRPLTIINPYCRPTQPRRLCSSWPAQ